MYFFAKCVVAILDSQSKVGGEIEISTKGVVDRREEGEGLSLPTPSLPTFTEIKDDGSENYR